MSNRFSSKESNRIKSEQDFTRDGVLQYDLQQNPTLIKRIRIPLFGGFSSDKPFPIYFPFKAIYVLPESDTTLTLYVKPNDESANNDYVPMKANDVLNFERKVAQAFLYLETDAGLSNNNDYIDVIIFTDAHFETGRKLNINSGAISQDIYGIDNNTYDIIDSPITVTRKFTRKVLNIYCNKDVQLNLPDESGAVGYLYPLKAGYYSFNVSGPFEIEILSNDTGLSISEEI